MKKKIYWFIWVALTLLMVSCSKESLEIGLPPLGKNDVQITLAVAGAATMTNTRVDAPAPVPGTPEEDVIHSVQLLFFQSGTFVRSVYRTTQAPNKVGEENIVWNSTAQTMVLRGFDTSKPYTIYAMTNYGEQNVNTEEAVKKLSTQITAQIEPPTLTKGLIMSGKVSDYNFQSNNKLTIDLKRQVVKMELYLKMDPAFVAAYPGIVWAADKDNAFYPKPMKVSLYNLATKSYIYEDLLNHTIPGTATDVIQYGPLTIKTVDGKWPVVSGYLYENLFTNPDFPATYAILNVPYRIGNLPAVNDNYYRIQFNHPLYPTKPFQLLRNYVYQVTATITGFGLKNPPLDGNLLSDFAVKPWNSYTVNGDVNEVKLNVASKQVVDFVNSNPGKIPFWTNQPTKIFVEEQGFINPSGAKIAFNVNDYFTDLTGIGASNVKEGTILLVPKAKGADANIKEMQIIVNVGGLRKNVTFSFRYILDITALTAITLARGKSYNTWTGTVANGTNGVYIYEPYLADNDASEPPYPKLEIATGNSTNGSWETARAACKDGWRAPRIREAYYMWNNNNLFSGKLNFQSFGLYIPSATERTSTNYWRSGTGIIGGVGAWLKSAEIPFRCVREIQ